MVFYPLLFEPNFHPVIWGGHQLRPYKGLEPSDEPIGESWEVSAVPSSTSVVSNGIWKGKDLISLINEYPEEILGKAVNRKYHGQLPLLVKFIDAERDLSIQVHPNDDMAQRQQGRSGHRDTLFRCQSDGSLKALSQRSEEIRKFHHYHVYRRRLQDTRAQHRRRNPVNARQQHFDTGSNCRLRYHPPQQ